MIMQLTDVLSHVILEDSIGTPVVIEGKKYQCNGFHPRVLPENTEKFRKCGFTMSDLFGLEPPRIFADAKRYQENYGVEIGLSFEEV
jgi:hypothetical protein